MGQPLVIEIADHRGRLLQRTRLGPGSCTIGRGYRNDIILDDQYVDAEHLEIASNGAGDWIVTDLGSRNGTTVVATGQFLRQALLQPGQELRIGHTTIRVFASDHPVPPAQPLGTGTGLMAQYVEPRRATAILAGALVFTGISQYLGSSSTQSFAELATPALGLLLLAALWATAWAFTNRIVAHRFRFISHLAWTALIIVGYSIVAIGIEWLEFLVPRFDWSLVQVGIGTGVFATLLAGHLQLVTDWTAARQWRVAVLAAAAGLVIVGIIGQADWLEDGENTVAVDRSPLKPVSSRLVPSSGPDRFFDRAADLKAEVDEMAGDDDGGAAEPAGESDPPDTTAASGAPGER